MLQQNQFTICYLKFLLNSKVSVQINLVKHQTYLIYITTHAMRGSRGEGGGRPPPPRFA